MSTARQHRTSYTIENGVAIDAAKFNARMIGANINPTGATNYTLLPWWKDPPASGVYQLKRDVAINTVFGIMRGTEDGVTGADQTFQVGHGVVYDVADIATGKLGLLNSSAADVFNVTIVGNSLSPAAGEIKVSNTAFSTITIPSTATAFGSKFLDIQVLLTQAAGGANTFEVRSRSMGTYTSAYAIIIRGAETNTDMDDGIAPFGFTDALAFGQFTPPVRADRQISIPNQNNSFAVRVGTSVFDANERCYLSLRVTGRHF